MAKGCKDSYHEVLEIRYYHHEPGSQQLAAMTERSGNDHSECTVIWKGLFVEHDGDGRASERAANDARRKKRKRLAWLERVLSELGVDMIRGMVFNTWDKALLDEDGVRSKWTG